ncbi:MAG: XRE family transcriptional regulator [Mariprofundaceae bacterium]
MPVSVKLRSLRESEGLSLRALAEVAGVSPATLSQIESGHTSPSVATLEKLADGLNINVSAFFLDNQPENTVEVFSLDDRSAVKLRSGCTLFPLAAQQQAVGFEPMLVHLDIGGEFNDDLYGISSPHAYAWVRHGEATLVLNENSFTVRETQSVYFNPREPHNWHNAGSQICEILIVRSRT